MQGVISAAKLVPTSRLHGMRVRRERPQLNRGVSQQPVPLLRGEQGGERLLDPVHHGEHFLVDGALEDRPRLLVICYKQGLAEPGRQGGERLLVGWVDWGQAQVGFLAVF